MVFGGREEFCKPGSTDVPLHIVQRFTQRRNLRKRVALHSGKECVHQQQGERIELDAGSNGERRPRRNCQFRVDGRADIFRQQAGQNQGLDLGLKVRFVSRGGGVPAIPHVVVAGGIVACDHEMV